MALSLGAYRSSVRAVLGNPPTDVISDEELDRDINAAYYEICRLFHHRRLKRDTTFDTVASTNEYALPADYFWMRVVKDDTSILKLDHKSLSWIEAREDGTEGPPTAWTTEDQNLRLWPTPDDTYTIHEWYYARPSRLTSVDQEDVLEEEWEEIIDRGSEARAFYRIGEYDRQIHAKNLQRSLINTITETQDLESVLGTDIAGPLDSVDYPAT